MKSDERRHLLREWDRDDVLIDELGIRDTRDYMRRLKRDEELRGFLAGLHKEMPEGMILGLLKRVGAVPEETEPHTFTNALGMTFVRIPAGSFMIGTSADEVEALVERYPDVPRKIFEAEMPQHRVTISQPFYMSIYPVTQGQWQESMGNNPSTFQGDVRRPVENVSWEEVQQFLAQLSALPDGCTYTLPSEAQWEYACRAGSTTAYHFGDEASQLGDYAWYHENAGRTTHPVGEKQPNAWGLYDMHGNVWEWCQDRYGDYSAFAAVDPQGPTAGANRVIRGGGWANDAQNARSADRYANHPGYRNDNLGFRCLSSAPSK